MVTGRLQPVGAVFVKFAVTPLPTCMKLFLVRVFEQPEEVVTCKVTLKFPADEYVCDGFCAVPVLPLPKSQSHEVIVELPALLPSVN